MTLKQGYYLLRLLGPRLLSLRAGVYLSHRLGTLRRAFPNRRWGEIRLSDIFLPGVPTDAPGYARFRTAQSPAFFFEVGRPPVIPPTFGSSDVTCRPDLAERVRHLEHLHCLYFFKTPSAERVQWYVNALTGGRCDPGQPWYEVPSFLPEQGDVRTIWDPSRAAWAIDLARWGARGMQPSAAATFRKWWDSWLNACPPFRGVHWMCGQESSVRLLAMSLAFWALGSELPPEDWGRLARLAWATGYRVAKHINYAISQKNNHAISEAMGLLLVSHLFPELRESSRWQERGRRVLQDELRRQIYDDGSYVQHSMNYQRVMLNSAIVGLRLAELAGRPFPRDVYERLGRAGEFLFQMMDTPTGRLPNYGPNDGSNTLPLSECDRLDYRPVIQTTHYLVHRRRLLPPGPWDEALIWLFGRDALASPQEEPRRPVSSAFEAGGYYTLRRPETWAMTRCHTYRDRQSQCDTLHVDLWYRGRNVLRDSGSYQYYIPSSPELEHFFKSIRAHNTVQVDGAEALGLVSRFLWLPWSRAVKRGFETGGNGPIWFEGQCVDYDRVPWNAVHRRTVISLDEASWVIVDDLLGAGRHELTLRWHLLDAPYEADEPGGRVRLSVDGRPMVVHVAGSPSGPGRFAVVRGCEEPGRVQGFDSPSYGERFAAPVIEVGGQYDLPQRFVTVVSPQHGSAARCSMEESGIETWRIEAASRVWLLGLRPANRSSDPTMIECRLAQEASV